MAKPVRVIAPLLVLLALLPLACSAPPPGIRPVQRPEGKLVSFAILEDYDKGDDLTAVARDFALMQELDIDTLRCSFGWDDYEPQPGVYDFTWLRQFVALADQYDIRLRPYIAYTPEWAGAEGTDDGMTWNNPPRSIEQWSDFVYALASTLADAPNVLSYEIYNEENTTFWWDGSVEQYGATLHAAAQAVRRADPDAEVLLGGLVYPDDDWLRSLIEQGRAPDYDVTPFHAYVETWSDTSVEEYLGPQYEDNFVPINDTLGEGEPIWINEMGYATSPGRSERAQANWFARAASTFLADPQIQHIGFYELRDLPRTSAALGDDANYYLGLLHTDGTKKLAFSTVDLITDLLDVGTLVVADQEAHITVTGGAAGDLHRHLFIRPDGRQVLFVYDKRSAPTVNVTVQRPGSRATAYALDGTSAPYAAFDGTTLANIPLSAGEVAIFVVEP